MLAMQKVAGVEGEWGSKSLGPSPRDRRGALPVRTREIESRGRGRKGWPTTCDGEKRAGAAVSELVEL